MDCAAAALGLIQPSIWPYNLGQNAQNHCNAVGVGKYKSCILCMYLIMIFYLGAFYDITVIVIIIIVVVTGGSIDRLKFARLLARPPVALSLPRPL